MLSLLNISTYSLFLLPPIMIRPLLTQQWQFFCSLFNFLCRYTVFSIHVLKIINFKTFSYPPQLKRVIFLFLYFSKYILKILLFSSYQPFGQCRDYLFHVVKSVLEVNMWRVINGWLTVYYKRFIWIVPLIKGVDVVIHH